MSDLGDAAELRFGIFLLDAHRRTLTADGKLVPLQQRTFDLLVYLIAHRTRAVAKSEILADLYGDQARASCNVPVQVHNLRRAISEAGGDAAMIQTVGPGYRFVGDLTGCASPVSVMESDTPADQASEVARPGRAVSKPAPLYLAAACLCLLAIVPWHNYQTNQPTPPFAPPPHTIAVLAFTNLSGNPAEEYLSDGLTEELIESLSRVSQLQVTAPSSSFYFKSRPATVEDIGRKLKVGSVLEGSLRREGGHLRIVARLSDARSGYRLWSETFDRTDGDMLKLQADIAGAVTKALKIKLLENQTAIFTDGGTPDAQALDYYLRGVQDIRSNNLGSYDAALSNFDAAIAHDPAFALAYSGRANALTFIGEVGAGKNLDAERAVFADARVAADKGVALAPALGATHAARATVLANGFLDMQGAWDEAIDAERLAPGSSTVDLLYALIAVSVGRRAEAVMAVRHAIELDPLRADAWVELGFLLRVGREFRDAFDAYQHAASLYGHDGPILNLERASAFLMQSKPQAARAACGEGAEWELVECRAIADHMLGREADGAKEMANLHLILGETGAYVYGQVLAQWGRKADALEWLVKARRLTDSGLAMMRYDPLLDPVRSQPGFAELQRSLHFPTTE